MSLFFFRLGLRIARGRQLKDAKKLRAMGMIDEANKIEELVRRHDATPVRTPEELIFRTKLDLTHQGRHEEAVMWEKIAEDRLKTLHAPRPIGEIKPVPSRTKQTVQILMIWAIALVFGFLVLQLSETPAGADPVEYEGVKLHLGLLLGGILAAIGCIGYIIWLAVRMFRNTRIQQFRTEKMDQKDPGSNS